MRRDKRLPRDAAGAIFPTNVGIRKQTIISKCAWVFVAAGIMLLSGCQSMPRQLVTLHHSRYQDVDRTCEALKVAIEARGFAYKGTLNLNESMARHGVTLRRQVRVVQFGRSKYAHEMLTAQPEISAFMPCRFGVYEDHDGTVYVSIANAALVARLFGGVVGEVMGKEIAPYHSEILKAVGTPVTRLPRQVSESLCQGEPRCEMYIGEYGSQ